MKGGFMGFKSGNFRHSYRLTNAENPLDDFLIPALESSVLYRRAAGYFSSAIFVHIAQGIAGLVANGGKMKLLTSHAFTTRDFESLNKKIQQDRLEDELFDSFQSDYNSLVQEIQRQHVRAMLWMLGNSLLEVKVVIPKKRLDVENPGTIALYHQKFGILSDAFHDQVGFAGSLNETVNGWLGNIENMNVYCSWKTEQNLYLQDYEEEFEKIWSGQAGADWEVVDLPEAVAQRLISANGVEDPARISRRREPETKTPRALRDYQEKALDAWVGAGRVGILEMATGTGKTRTAKACLNHTLEAFPSLLTVVVAPYQHIADQWAKELSHLRLFEIAASSNWRRDLEVLKTEAVFGRIKDLTIVVVKNTAGSKDFLNLVEAMLSSFERLLLIGDEVHWLGANAYRPALNERAHFRLGLSATPARYFDEDGSEFLQSYFRKDEDRDATVYRFSLSEALKYDDQVTGKKILCPYNYFPVFVGLNAVEQEDFDRWTQSIAVALSQDQTAETRERISELRIARSMVLKKAASKVPALKELIESLGLDSITQALIYCAESEQMDLVANTLSGLRLDFGRITSAEGSRPSRRLGGKSEREVIIDSFAESRLNTLLAIDCLDEGVDIPSAQLGFILASSGNPKEFIQRRGRLLRQFPGKTHADIYDFVVLPSDSAPENNSIQKIELSRILEFASDAQNRNDVIQLLKTRYNYEEKSEK